MIKYLGIFVGMQIGMVCLGQDTLISWYAGPNQVTSEEQAVSYRKFWKEDTLWKVKDCFMNGVIRMEGSYLSFYPEVKEGEFIFYHMNGNKLSEGKYQDNYKIGMWSEWYIDGSLHAKGNYIQPGVQFEEVDEFDYFSGDSVEVGDWRNGEWDFYHSNGQLGARITFRDNVINSEAYWQEDGTETKNYAEDRHPEFRGGDQALMRFLGNSIRYPDKDKKLGTSGFAYVHFVVDRNGNILNPVVVKSLSETIDAECLRVVRSMPRWKPGIQYNCRIDMEYMLPIRFTYKIGNGRKLK